MTKFWELFQGSIIIQSLITLLLVGVVVYQAIMQIETPDLVETLAYLVIGFWFGSKVENVATKEVVKKLTDGSG